VGVFYSVLVAEPQSEWGATFLTAHIVYHYAKCAKLITQKDVLLPTYLSMRRLQWLIYVLVALSHHVCGPVPPPCHLTIGQNYHPRPRTQVAAQSALQTAHLWRSFQVGSMWGATVTLIRLHRAISHFMTCSHLAGFSRFLNKLFERPHLVYN
jgi:hypothetical protein